MGDFSECYTKPSWIDLITSPNFSPVGNRIIHSRPWQHFFVASFPTCREYFFTQAVNGMLANVTNTGLKYFHVQYLGFWDPLRLLLEE